MPAKKKESAGLLLFRFHNNKLQFLLVHPGGPFWAKKDLGAWSIPKGELEEGEDPLICAQREFEEEMGVKVSGKFLPLLPQKLKSGKIIQAWALESDFNVPDLRSNTFEIEWPPLSRKYKEFPEVDKAAWLEENAALEKINPGQAGFIKELAQICAK